MAGISPASPIMATLGGAAVVGTLGGIMDALIGMDLTGYEAKRYEGKLKSGNFLISVHNDNSHEITRAKKIFTNAGADDISSPDESFSK